MSKRQSEWRTNIDKYIVEFFHDYNFENFNGASYIFPIGETGAVVVFLGHKVLQSEDGPSEIQVQIGLINWQLAELNHLLVGAVKEEWTLHFWGHELLEETQYVLYEHESEESRKNLISTIISTVKTAVVPKFESNYHSVSAVVEELFKQQESASESNLCIGLAMLGRDADAEKTFVELDEKNKTRRSRPFWNQFAAKYTAWLSDGKHVPDVSAAKAEVLRRGAERREKLIREKRDFRPDSY